MTVENSSENAFGQENTEELLEAAVLKSGYPLQRVVAAELKKSFSRVTEEWSYIDRTTEEPRELDVFAFQALRGESEHRIKPAVILLVECKRAELPHVFFKTAVGVRSDDFPRVLGLAREAMTLKDASNRSRSISLIDALQLSNEPFIADGPPLCTGFSRAVRKGKHLILSGASPFRRLFLPLVSALTHAIKYYTPPGSPKLYWANLTFCVAVLDGPMVVAESDPEHPNLSLQPWVRVVRHEVSLKDKGVRRETYYAIDVVHRSFLANFVRRHLFPFANVFAERVEAVHESLFLGHGCVADVDRLDWREIKPG